MKLNKIETQMKEIAKLYFIALRNINYQSFSSGEEDVYSPFYKYYMDVEETFKQLSKEEKTLINNEYFYNDYLDWWKKIYKPSEFIRLKKKAIRAFVEVFYEIH